MDRIAQAPQEERADLFRRASGILRPERAPGIIEKDFWEKATILHAEYHRPADKPMAAGMSRHYYDLDQLSRQEIGRHALEHGSLLARVVAHKRLFFASAWAHYDTAMPGSLCLVPQEEQASQLRVDYARMREMIFGEAPPWEQIVQGLQELEGQINRS